ncbi:right-handed parallel beta-helix repeat-containing protein [Rubellimicrobium aerolatum]|uniref:Right-handed parallel beta-helix repeat-containing protein n=1 Tax=Rubellimicrobium aerolatum TaxID=490979 RepID=A0ABW0SFT2_9RHOB|nr:right-handed parallel beta-helix repeat-containing protein [Rubellimicrobium aerolatum]MBP1807286.1 PKD repeat protein [Rubellimicrobium aerolatum]
MTATTITVSTQQELSSALARATGGETILLAPGDYGDLALRSSNFASPSPAVTIASADPADPASFSGLGLHGVSNLRLDGLLFDYTFSSGDPAFSSPFAVSGSTNIAIVNSVFDGDVAQGVSSVSDGYGTARGLSVSNSSGVTIEGNEFRVFYRALVVGNSSDILVKDNDIHSIRMDGMNFADVQGVTIEGNYIHDFQASLLSGDHRDMIQFWTTGTSEASRDIVIRDNLLDIGLGDSTQSIFMRNEEVDSGRAGEELFYRNVLIENNTIINAHLHGISVGETLGLTIRDNSVLHADGRLADGQDPSVEIPRISVAAASTDVLIEGNLSGGIRSATDFPTWTVRDNMTVQDQNPLAEGWYGDLFIASTLANDADLRLVALPGGEIAATGVGSSATSAAGLGLTPLFHLSAPDAATRVFDASVSSYGAGYLPAGTSFHWTFGDGTTAEGVKVAHSYTQGGTYAAVLTVTLPDGSSATEQLDIVVREPELLRLGSTGFVATEAGIESALGAVAQITADGLQLGATGTTVAVEREHVADVVGSDDMTIAFSLDADRAGASGELFRLHGSFIAAVNTAGELVFQVMRDDEATAVVTTVGAALNATADVWHDVVIDLHEGDLDIWVDGLLRAHMDDLGVVGGTGFGSQMLMFGNPWGRTNFDGDLGAFVLSDDDGSFADSPETIVIEAELRNFSDPNLLVPATSAIEAFGAAFGDFLPAWADAFNDLPETSAGAA